MKHSSNKPGAAVPFCLAVMILGSVQAADQDAFVPLFNGRDLSGWVNANCAPETWRVRDGVIFCTGKPTGAMRTARQYENFILEVEWRHLSSGGNSGVFIWGTPIAAPGVPFLRGIEVQVLDNGYNVRGRNEWYTTHGDVFPIHGATMKPFGRYNGSRSFPSEERSKSSPEWNHYRIVCTNGVIRLSVNGKEVSGGEECNYRKGYLALESEGAPVEFRNVRIKELPSSGAAAELTAPEDQGWKSLFNGLDLRGWKTNAATAGRWDVQGERIVLRPGPMQREAKLWAAVELGNFEWVLDCRPAKEGTATMVPSVRVQRGEGPGLEVPLAGSEPGRYTRFVVSLRGTQVTLTSEGKAAQSFTLPEGAERARIGLQATERTAEFMNLYVRDL